MTPEPGPDGRPQRRAGVGSRREARERALALLYEAEARGATPSAVLAELAVPAEPFAVELATGVGAHLDEIDALLTLYARDWRVDRMPAIDRAVLRIAAFELLYHPATPSAAVLSEAVALAGRYSTEESSRFVNGVLGAIAAQRPPATRGEADPRPMP